MRLLLFSDVHRNLRVGCSLVDQLKEVDGR